MRRTLATPYLATSASRPAMILGDALSPSIRSASVDAVSGIGRAYAIRARQRNPSWQAPQMMWFPRVRGRPILRRQAEKRPHGARDRAGLLAGGGGGEIEALAGGEGDARIEAVERLVDLDHFEF